MAAPDMGWPARDEQALHDLFKGTNDSAGGNAWSQTEGWLRSGDLNKWLGVSAETGNRVRFLGLNKNNLTGELPESLGDLKMLVMLRLSHNSLTGSIPSSLGRLPGLRILNLSNNKLEGSIPPQLSSLHALEDLTLSTNKLEGSIPESLAGLTKLTMLLLDGNRLQGIIPPQFGGLSNIKSLDLSNNRLEGTVPAGLWRLQNLVRLDFHLNKLERLTDETDGAAAGQEVVDFLQTIDDLDVHVDSKGVNMDSNPWELPPASVVVNGRESIKSYYEAWEGGQLELTRALKVVFLGTAAAGKTSLMQRIGAERRDLTHGEGHRTRGMVDLYTHELRDGTRCNMYDLPGQLDDMGLYQVFLTEWALYIVVFDATHFEGKQGKELTKATETHILDWVTLLHLRLKVCTVQLVATHCDQLGGSAAQATALLETVEAKFRILHEHWIDDRLKHRHDNHDGGTDRQILVSTGIIPVGYCLSSEGDTQDQGLTRLGTKVLEESATKSLIPLSWVEASKVLDAICDAMDEPVYTNTGRTRGRRAWAMREDIHERFFGETQKSNCLVRGHSEDAARKAMDGAIAMREFGGTLLSHDVYVFLDISYLAAKLAPILYDKVNDRSSIGVVKFPGKALSRMALTSTTLLMYRDELIKQGILRREFASFLYRDPTEQEDVQGILVNLGLAIPLPQLHEASSHMSSLTYGGWRCARGHRPDKPPQNTSGQDGKSACTDLLVLMRLDKQPTEKMLDEIARLRRTAGDADHMSLKSKWKFDFSGVPSGFPERVIALCHRLGDVSRIVFWRHGALFTREENGEAAKAKALVIYDDNKKSLTFETMGREEWDFVSLRFVVSAVQSVTRTFRGVVWDGWVVCARHDQKMYFLANSSDHLNGPKAADEDGLEVIPRKGLNVEQRNMCDFSHEGCAVPLAKFGLTVNVMDAIDRSTTVAAQGAAGTISERQTQLAAICIVVAGALLTWGLDGSHAVGLWVAAVFFAVAVALIVKKCNTLRCTALPNISSARTEELPA